MGTKQLITIYFVILISLLFGLKKYVRASAEPSYQQEQKHQDIKPQDLEKQVSESNSSSESPCCSRHDKVKIACLTGTVTVLTAAISAATALAIHFGNCK